MAVNSPIQGSAADLIKVAMINVLKALHADLPHTKMILQVHDELIFEVPEKELEEAKQLVKAEMESTGKKVGLSVPASDKWIWVRGIIGEWRIRS